MRWEYKAIVLKLGTFSSTEEHNRQIEEQMNQLGAVGWELVNYVVMGSKYRAIFKRAK